MASAKTPLVVIAFSLADSVGSGIVVEIARHLSSIKLGPATVGGRRRRAAVPTPDATPSSR